MKQWSGTLAAMACAFLASRAMAFQVTLDSGVTSVVILDNEIGDLNTAPGVIDFNTIVGGVLWADARVQQLTGAPNRSIHIGGRSGAGLFANLGAAPGDFTVTVEMDTFAATGPPLGWGVFVDTLGVDATLPVPGDVAIPTNDLFVQADPGGVPVTTVSLPIAPPVPPVDQPVSLSTGSRGVVAAGSATGLRVVWSFTPGAFDQLRLPSPSSLGDAAVIVNLFSTQTKCVIRMNDDATKLAGSAGKDDARCVRDAIQLAANATFCVDNPDTKRTATSEDKLLDDVGFYCDQPPAFGVNLGTCCEGGAFDGNACASPASCGGAGASCTVGACISGAVEDAARAITHDLFGPNVNVSISTAGRCQAKVTAELGKLDNQRWAVLTECKRRNIANLASEADFAATCFAAPQPDPSRKIAKAETRLARHIERDCIDRIVTPLGTLFPGACAGEADADFAVCLSQRVACRFCQGAVVADDVASLVNCDAVDDGVANGSCP